MTIIHSSFPEDTVVENYRNSLIASKASYIYSVTRQVNFNWTQIGGRCQNWQTKMRHFGWFSNTVMEEMKNAVLGKKDQSWWQLLLWLGCFIWMAKQWSQQIAVWKCFHFVKTVCSHNTLLKKQRQTLFYLPYIKALRQYGKNNGPLPLHYFLHCHNF